jgi:hypothetical protein
MIRKLFVALLLVSAVFAQEVKRPTADASPGGVVCTGDVWDGQVAMLPMAGTTMTADGDIGGPGDIHEVNDYLTTWETTVNTYTALDLKFDTQCAITNTNPAAGCNIQYSLDSGGSWTVARSGTSWARVTDTISLSTGQNLANIKIQMCALGKDGATGGTTSHATLTVFDIFTSGTVTGSSNRRKQTTQSE